MIKIGIDAVTSISWRFVSIRAQFTNHDYQRSYSYNKNRIAAGI
jgi:hypothetical protein